MCSTRAALEAALVAEPDDATAHAAYADLLLEEGDPRGDYLRHLLLLEDKDQPADRLAAAFGAVRDLEREYRDDWLGPLAGFLGRPQHRTGVTLRFRRGWVEDLTAWHLTADLIAAVVGSPVCRLVRDFRVVGTGLPFRAADDLGPLFRFLRSTPLERLDFSSDQFGDAGAAELAEVGLPPRLEVLHLLGCRITAAGVAALTECDGADRLRTVIVG